MVEDKDISILLRLKNNDHTAFKELYDCYFIAIYRYMYMYIPDKAIVEDAALDIFYNLWNSRDRIVIKAGFKSYLFAAARNRSLNIIRDRKHFVDIGKMSEILESNVEYGIEAKELEELIQEAIMSLPGRCQEIFLMSRDGNYPNNEIANKFGISKRTVETQISKALKLLRRYIDTKYKYIWVLYLFSKYL